MKKILFLLLLSPLFITVCYADDLYAGLGELGEVYSIQDALPESERDISGELRIDGSYDTEAALQRLWRRFLDAGKEYFSSEIRAAVELFLLALLCALTACFCSSKEIRETIDRIGCCAAALLVAGSFSGLLTQATDTVRQLSDYSHVILPVVFTTAAAGGALISASTRFASACLAMDVMLTAAQNYILPMIYMYFALVISRGLFENGILQAASRLCKWCVTTSMTVLTLVFGAYLSLTGLIAGSGDALAVKTARTVISRSLPIVGSLLSDSAAVLLSAATLIKNSVGVFTLIAVCALCVGPFAAFSIKLLVFKATAAAAEFLPESRLPKLIGEMGSVFGMLLGLIGCCAVLLFMAITSGIKVVGPT